MREWERERWKKGTWKDGKGKMEREGWKGNEGKEVMNETTIKVKGGVRLRDIARKPFGRNIRFNITPLTDNVLY